MEVSVEELEPCRKKVAITIGADQVREAFDKKYGELNDAVALPGFRPGRAPRPLLEKRFASKLGDEVKHDLIKEALESIIEDKTVDPLQVSEVDFEALTIEPESDLAFEIEVVTKPEFETPPYKGLDVTVPPIEVTDEEIETGINGLRRRDAELTPVDDAAIQEDDILVVDWSARDGDSVEAQDDGVYYPLGKGLIGGFVVHTLEEQLNGKGVGATATETVRLAPDDPREDLRERDLELSVTVTEVHRYVLPEIDETFLKSHDYDDVKELRADVRKRIERLKARDRDLLAEQRLVDELVDGITFSLPEEFVANELDKWAARRRMQLQMEEKGEEEIAREIEAARSDSKAAIERDLRRYFLLDRIASEEEIEATGAELEAQIHAIARAYGHPVEAVLASFRDGGRIEELAIEIRHRKARELIRREASIIEGAPEEGPDPEKKAAKKTKSKAKK